ncbi:MAG: uL15 family ribosomal protein [Candidatus Thermoplasmatota archaeon]|nr:uL15 family ribosomal protein [Candidatus Thermoplasmatota archaeon]
MVKYDPLRYGGKGFTSHHHGRPAIPITLRELGVMLPELKKNGFVSEEGEITEIDLKTAGFGKLLGSGEFGLKSKIIVPHATEKAISKLSAHGITVETDARGSEE